MAKAAEGSTTSNPDAAVFAAIRRCAALWRQCKSLDEKPCSPTYEASTARADELCTEACDLEWRIAKATVRTAKGLSAKICAIRRADFDKSDFPEILQILERDATRVAVAIG